MAWDPSPHFYQIEWNLTPLQTGFIVSAVNIGPMFSMLAFGYLMDKKGKNTLSGGDHFIGPLSFNASFC